jgi:hypothetical protein
VIDRAGVRRWPTLAWRASLVVFATLLLGCVGSGGSIERTKGAESAAFVLLWAGDTLLADAAQPLLDAEGYLAPFSHLAPLPVADYVIANLEGPITTRTAPWDPDQRWSYHGQPAAADALATIGIDAVSLANNHTLDRGPEGLADTIMTLEAAAVATFGAGANQDEAAAPLLIETPYGIVAVVGFGEDSSPARLASRTTAGSLVPSYSAVQRGRDLGRAAGARWLVAFVHWGTNYRTIDGEQRRWAQRFANAGYDLVVGHGPHLAQRIEFVDGMPVFYSVGNFVFGTPGRYTDAAPGISLLLTTELTQEGFRRATLTCLLTDNDEVAFRPSRCRETQADTRLSALHPDIETIDGTTSLSW